MLRVALASSFLLSSLLLLPAGAQAADLSSTFESSASVIPSCSITKIRDPIVIKYDPVKANATANAASGFGSHGAFQVKCNRQPGIKFAVGEGLNASAGSSCDAPLRQMKNQNGALLGYRLQRSNVDTSNGQSTALGCGANNMVDIQYPEGNPSLIYSVGIFVVIHGGQAAEVGAYADTVTASVIF